jgi:hypothetical protein
MIHTNVEYLAANLLVFVFAARLALDHLKD